MFWRRCDVILVSALILVVCQAFSILYTFLSRRASTSKYVLLPYTKYQTSEGKQNTRTHEKKEENHDMQVRRIPCVASKHRTDANRANTVYIILRSLSLKSQQKISSFKLFCCHHNAHYISRTLDLCSLLLSAYCSTQASFARSSTSHRSP